MSWFGWLFIIGLPILLSLLVCLLAVLVAWRRRRKALPNDSTAIEHHPPIASP